MADGAVASLTGGRRNMNGAARGMPWKMPRTLRAATYSTCALLWTTGCLWIALHYGFPERTEFGTGPNSWEPLTIRVHGVLATLCVFLLGVITSRHIAYTWQQQRNRVSGIVLSSVGALLVVSGYALYYVIDDRSRTGIALLHEVVGAAAIAFALTHWLRSK